MKFKYSTFNPHLRDQGGWGNIFITVMLIYWHWVIMVYNENLSDILVLETCEVLYHKKAKIAFALA